MSLAAANNKAKAEKAEKEAKSSKKDRQILFRTSFRNTILDGLLARGYREVEEGERWDFNWADVGWVRATTAFPVAIPMRRTTLIAFGRAVIIHAPSRICRVIDISPSPGFPPR